MKLLRHRSKILRHRGKTIHEHHALGGSINHLMRHRGSHGGNIAELKNQLKHMLVAPKKAHRIRF